MPGKHHLRGFKIAKKNRLAATRLVDDGSNPPLGKKLDPPLKYIDPALIYIIFYMQQILSDIDSVLEKINKDHRNQTSACFVFMSHGNSEGIFGIEAKDETDVNAVVKVEDIKNKLTARACRRLEGKLKLVFIQACRGSRFSFNVSYIIKNYLHEIREVVEHTCIIIKIYPYNSLHKLFKSVYNYRYTSKIFMWHNHKSLFFCTTNFNINSRNDYHKSHIKIKCLHKCCPQFMCNFIMILEIFQILSCMAWCNRVYMIHSSL